MVVRVFAEEGFGFVKTLAGREVYFHRNSLLNNGFDQLKIGTGVRVVVSDGEKGPLASTVHIITDKPGINAAGTAGPAVEMSASWQP